MILICLHRTEFSQITPINEQTRLKEQHLTTIHTTTMYSKELKRPQSSSNAKKVKTKNIIKGGFVQENVEINDQFLDESLDNKDI